MRYIHIFRRIIILNKIKKLFNTKPKKIAAIIIAIIFFLILCIALGNNDNSNTYESMIQAVCTEDYDLVKEYIDALPDDYKDTADIMSFISIVETFDENKKDSYSLTLENLNKISKFNDNRLNDIYNDFFENVSNLEIQYQNDKATARLIVNEINSIAEGNINNIQLSDDELINTARYKYDNCSESVKELITNAEFLNDAEQRINLLKEYKASADAVYEQIEKIGSVTLNSENAISTAYSAYDNLSDEAKSYVTNIDSLVNAKKQFEELKEKKEQQEKDKKSETTKSSKSSNSTKSVESNKSSGTVYWVSSGKVYHTTKDCPTLSRSKNIKSGSAPSGRRACKVCS